MSTRPDGRVRTPMSRICAPVTADGYPLGVPTRSLCRAGSEAGKRCAASELGSAGRALFRRRSRSRGLVHPSRRRLPLIIADAENADLFGTEDFDRVFRPWRPNPAQGRGLRPTGAGRQLRGLARRRARRALQGRSRRALRFVSAVARIDIDGRGFRRVRPRDRRADLDGISWHHGAHKPAEHARTAFVAGLAGYRRTCDHRPARRRARNADAGVSPRECPARSACG